MDYEKEIKNLLDAYIPPRYHKTWMTGGSILFGGKSAKEMIALGKAEDVYIAFKRCFQ